MYIYSKLRLELLTAKHSVDSLQCMKGFSNVTFISLATKQSVFQSLQDFSVNS